MSSRPNILEQALKIWFSGTSPHVATQKHLETGRNPVHLAEMCKRLGKIMFFGEGWLSHSQTKSGCPGVYTCCTVKNCCEICLLLHSHTFSLLDQILHITNDGGRSRASLAETGVEKNIPLQKMGQHGWLHVSEKLQEGYIIQYFPKYSESQRHRRNTCLVGNHRSWCCFQSGCFRLPQPPTSYRNHPE